MQTLKKPMLTMGFLVNVDINLSKIGRYGALHERIVWVYGIH